MCGTVEKWRRFFDNIRGLLLRLLYLLHGFITVYILYVNKEFKNIHMVLFIPLILLFLESVATVCFKMECKYVWPCGFFYIASIVPVIWVLELGLLEKRIGAASSNSTIVVPFSKLVSSVISKGSSNKTGISPSFARRVLIETMTISDENGRRLAELGVIMGLIIGRWLTPDALKGKEISALLLSYVGNAADILEVLESLGTEGVTYSRHATVGILGIYSWSLLQFTLVTTWETEEQIEYGKEDNDIHLRNSKVLSTPSKPSVSRNSKVFFTSPKASTSRNSKVSFTTIKKYSSIENEEDEYDIDIDYSTFSDSPPNDIVKARPNSSFCWGYYHQEFPQMLVQIMMQDGPFLFLRLALVVKYDIISELHIFFLCKNALVILILVYRFAVLLNERRIRKNRRSVIDSEDVEALASERIGSEHSTSPEKRNESQTSNVENDKIYLIEDLPSLNEDEQVPCPERESTDQALDTKADSLNKEILSVDGDDHFSALDIKDDEVRLIDEAISLHEDEQFSTLENNINDQTQGSKDAENDKAHLVEEATILNDSSAVEIRNKEQPFDIENDIDEIVKDIMSFTDFKSHDE